MKNYLSIVLFSCVRFTGSILNKKSALLLWIVLLCLLIILYFYSTNFFVFPLRYKFPFLLGILFIGCLSGVLTILSKGRGIVSCFFNIFIILLILVILFLLPFIESKIKDIFLKQNVFSTVINVYALKDDAKNEITEYQNPVFIILNSNDLENQNYAIKEINNIFNKNVVQLVKEDLISSAKALLDKEGNLLVLNEAYIDLIEEFDGYTTFGDKVKIVYSIERRIETETERPLVKTDITNTPFTVFAAGCDTRSGRLSVYGRTDVNLMLTVNPNTKQILIVGIPRDSYIPNPAINYEDDKLTHLGNAGIYNTMKGVSEYFDIDINYYGEVIFNTFKDIIDALGGIDVDNPYYFTTAGGNGGQYSEKDYSFERGTIHLTGDSALAYCRERYNLSNGDYGRNEHQTIVLKAIMKKAFSKEILDRYILVWDAIKGQVLTDFDVDDLFDLINMQINDNSEWDIISYHLGGIGDMQGTASMGWNRKLYVVHLFDSQVKFVKEQIELMMNDERIEQKELPQEGETTYIPN